jgi:hypothetical protein
MNAFTVVSTTESRAAETRRLRAIVDKAHLASETAAYRAPTITAEDERVWAAVEAMAHE